MVTGMRGLCNGLGPAMFGVIFYLFHVDLNDKQNTEINHIDDSIKNETINTMEQYTALAPGPPFVFGAFMVVIAIMVAVFIPEEPSDQVRRPSGEKKKSSYPSFFYFFYFVFFVWVVVIVPESKVNYEFQKILF